MRRPRFEAQRKARPLTEMRAGLNASRYPFGRRSAMRVILRHIRRAAAFAASGDKVGGVVILVGSHRAARVGIVLDHAEGGGTLSCAIGLGQLSSFLHPREVDGT